MIEAFCYWVKTNGDTLVTHTLCGGSIRMVKQDGENIWVCSYCKDHSDKINITMKQDDNTIGVTVH